MTTSRLPEITVTCRKNHAFRTRAHGGQGVDCPQCRADGERVKVWIRKDRPRTARELADHEAIDAPGPAATVRPDAELAARWARESPWDGKTRLAGGRDSDACPKCSGPVQWEPGRTLIYCQPCKWGGLPPVVTKHYARQAQRSAEVAVQDAPNLASKRAARVRLRAMAQRVADHVGEWIETFNPDGLNGNAERLALDYQAELAAYLPEIKQAKSEDELADIAAEITEVTSRAASSGALAMVAQQREAIERQEEQAAREAEWAETERQQAAQERAELERAERAERQAAIAARSERRAIESQTVRRTGGYRVINAQPSQNGYMTAAVGIAAMIEKSRTEKKRKLDEYGPCGYEDEHRKPEVPTRRYWIMALDWQGNESGYAAPGAPQAVVCKKHFTKADAWIEEQATALKRTNPMIKAVYTELT